MKDVRVILREVFEKTKDVIRREATLTRESVELIGQLKRMNAAVNLGIAERDFPASLGLTVDQYYKRLQAWRVMSQFPEFKQMLEAGATSIGALALVAPKITPANSLVISAALPGKSKRDLQLFLSRVRPDGTLQEGEETIEIKVALTRSELMALERAVDVLSARGKVPSKKEALMKGIELLVSAKDPVMAAERAQARAERLARKAQESAPSQARAERRPDPASAEESHASEPGDAKADQDLVKGENPSRSRDERHAASGSVDGTYGVEATQSPVEVGGSKAQSPAPGQADRSSARRRSYERESIPAATRHAVMLRDLGQCVEVLADGSRCPERRMVEFDHLVPVCRGGTSSIENISLKCKSHNLAAAERLLGKGYMDRWRKDRAVVNEGAKGCGS